MNVLSQRLRATLNHTLLRAVPLAVATLFATGAQAAVLISQVYGGGGNSGAPLTNDFVELCNNGAQPVSLAGWSVQYASSAGTSWVNSVPLAGSIPAGGRFLIQMAGGANGMPLPTPDVSGNTNMSGTAGKVALVNSTAILSGSCPTGNATVVDFLGYGSATNCALGPPPTGTPTANLSNTTAALRGGGNSCTSTGNNSADFVIGAPNPRNSGGGGGGGGGGDPIAAAIFTIQGTGATSPLVGQLVTTTGAVTKLTSNGFFIQDVAGDGNPATSDGIFVFTSAAPPAAAAVGNLVSVTGTVVEFASGAGSAATPLTQISSTTVITNIGSAAPITPVAVTLPLAEGQSLEPLEGMLVSINGSLRVQQNFVQARFGQLTLGVGRHENPTNRFRPGAQAIALATEQARSRILLDDGSSFQNPNPTPYFGANGVPRAGDSVSGLVGVLDFGPAGSSAAGPGLYRVQPTQSPVFAAFNPRPSAPSGVGGNYLVAAMNVLNYFTTFTNGGTASGQSGQGCSLGGSVSASNCRGANNAVEFGRQQAKIVQALVRLNADAVGLMEIQNNGNVAAQNLVDALNALAGPGAYVVVPVPAFTGTDAIRVAMIYKPDRLTLTGAPLSDPDPVNNRPTLAQTFTATNGEKFSLVVNHFKSKGSCPSASAPDALGNTDAGDGQGCWNLTRLQQAQRLRTFVSQVQAAAGSPDALVVGDLNSYGQEDPIFELTGNGYVDEALRSNAFAYTYVFDATAGRLDYAISSSTMSPKVAGARAWHINADEQTAYDYNQEFKAPLTTCGGPCPADPYAPDAFRSSDHDPLLVGVDLYKTVAATTQRQLLTGTLGADRFVFSSVLQAGSSVIGFQPNVDQIVVKDILRSLGRSAVANPLGLGFITCGPTRMGAAIGIDSDGAAGPQPPRALVQLNGQNCAAVMNAQNFVTR